MTKTISSLSAAALALGVFGGAASALAQEANLDAARALIEEASQLPTFNPPGEPFDAKACAADKKLYVIPLTTENPFNVEIAKAQEEAAGVVGLDITVSDNQLNIDQWVQAISTAIADGYDAIDIQGGVPPEAVGPQLAEAREAGLKIVATHLYDVTQEKSDLIDGNFAMNYTRAGQLMAAWAMDKTEGQVNAVIIGSDEILPTGPFVKAIQDYLDENCPDCTHKYINVPVVEWGSRIQPEVQSALVADPDINYVLPIYDSMSAFVVPALTLSNREDVRIATYNGTPFVLDMLRDGDLVEMNVGESLAWVGWAGIDAALRVLCDEGEVTQLNTPLYIFDDSNVETAGVPAGYEMGYGDGHVAGFRGLWGME